MTKRPRPVTKREAYAYIKELAMKKELERQASVTEAHAFLRDFVRRKRRERLKRIKEEQEDPYHYMTRTKAESMKICKMIELYTAILRGISLEIFALNRWQSPDPGMWPTMSMVDQWRVKP